MVVTRDKLQLDVSSLIRDENSDKVSYGEHAARCSTKIKAVRKMFPKGSEDPENTLAVS